MDYRERQKETTNLPSDGSEEMGTDSVGTHEDYKDYPQKRKRSNTQLVGDNKQNNSSMKGINEGDKAVDISLDNDTEEDDSSVETVQIQSGLGLSRTWFGLMLSPAPLETEPDKN